MANENRPINREKNVSGQGKGVHRRGEGLGTGPVGSGSSPVGGGAPAGGQPEQTQRASYAGGGSGRRSSPLILILIVAVLLFGGGGKILGLLGGGDLGELPASGYESLLPGTQTGGQSTSVTPSAKPAPTGSLLFGGGNSWSGGSASSAGWSAAPNTGVLDRSVAEGARDKYTEIVGDGKDRVTVMVYMCGSDLESRSGMASRDLLEMQNAKLSRNVNLIVYTGGAAQWNNRVVSKQVNQIYQIRDGGMTPVQPNAGRDSMTDPNTLQSFIEFGVKNFRANRYILILWDHGGGSLSGYGYDEKHQSSGSMSLASLDSALKASKVKFDFIGFDACLMATVENASMLSAYADYMIASEETEPGIGWYYTDWLTALSADTSMSTLDVGKQIVDDFVRECARQCGGQATTLSVVDLAELSATLPDSLRSFSTGLKDRITGGDYQSVAAARGNTREFASSTKIDQIDFVDFAGRLGTEEGKELTKALLGAVKYNRTSSSVTNAYGLSVYFPLKKISSVDKAVRTYDALGMDESYTACIREFASLEVSGQIASGGASNNPYASLLGDYSGGYVSGGSMADISQLLQSAMSGDLSSLLGGAGFLGGRSLEETEAAAEYFAANRFDPSLLFWQRSVDGDYVISLDEKQWSLVQDVALNLFVDDGTGYVDMGLDNLFSFDENGNLLPDTEGTWISINDQPVAYYFVSASADEDGGTTITGYVPAMLNGELVKLVLIFNDEYPQGFIAGAQIEYDPKETETLPRGLIELKDGDRLDFVCDYYSYDGEYLDSYLLGETITVDGALRISDTYIGQPTRILYRFTDIYQQHYWTQVLPQD
ncbi:MAG: peptidase C11 [Oscillospiraceae bacterium]|nr:peptidase C11 [Oscillospiraceae bacterium]